MRLPKILASTVITLIGLAATALPVLAQSDSDVPVQASVSVCFMPGERCFDQIVAAIGSARVGIRVQAYGFTSTRVLSALAAARKRGVVVEAILDKSNRRQNGGAAYTGATYLAHAGAEVWIDYRPAIAHNKVIIIDQHLVIGGSANYTKSAETRNAENVLFIESADMAGRFLDNWEARRDASERYVAPD